MDALAPRQLHRILPLFADLVLTILSLQQEPNRRLGGRTSPLNSPAPPVLLIFSQPHVTRDFNQPMPL